MVWAGAARMAVLFAENVGAALAGTTHSLSSTWAWLSAEKHNRAPDWMGEIGSGLCVYAMCSARIPDDVDDAVEMTRI